MKPAKYTSVKDAGDLLRTHGIKANSRNTIYRLIEKGMILSSRSKDGMVLIVTSSLDAYIIEVKGIDNDWFVGMYARTSTLKDANKVRLYKGGMKLWEYLDQVRMEIDIPLERKGWEYTNVKFYADQGSINEPKPYDLPNLMELFKDAALGYVGKGPKMKYLIIEYIDRWTKGDIRTWMTWAKAMGISLFCKDVTDKDEEEIIRLTGENMVKSIYERHNARVNKGKNFTKAQRQEIFAPIIPRMLKAKKASKDLRQKGQIEGFLKAYDDGDLSVKLAESMTKFLDQLN